MQCLQTHKATANMKDKWFNQAEHPQGLPEVHGLLEVNNTLSAVSSVPFWCHPVSLSYSALACSKSPPSWASNALWVISCLVKCFWKSARTMSSSPTTLYNRASSNQASSSGRCCCSRLICPPCPLWRFLLRSAVGSGNVSCIISFSSKRMPEWRFVDLRLTEPTSFGEIQISGSWRHRDCTQLTKEIPLQVRCKAASSPILTSALISWPTEGKQ